MEGTQLHQTVKVDRSLSIEDVCKVAKGERVGFDDIAGLTQNIEANHRFFLSCVQSGQDIYGVTSGFGQSSHRRVGVDQSAELQRNLSLYHRCGVGPYASYSVSRAVLLSRLRCLSRARSGVKIQILLRLVEFLNHDIVPAIPMLGSVGASGDLTPLSYVAAVLQGQHQVIRPDGSTEATCRVLEKLGLKPHHLDGREGLALMNGTSFMSAIAALAWQNARDLALQAARITGCLVEVLGARTSPFAELLHDQKPHAGQLEATREIAKFIHSSPNRLLPDPGQRVRRGIQDSYSIRCAPQVLGMLFESLSWSKQLIETELNGVSDNPVFVHENEAILNGGQFFGGHIAMACDSLKSAVAAVLNLVDRQVALLMDGRYDDLLPESLRAESTLGDESNCHHGFKAMQITLSSLAAECAKNSMPMAVFSRPTESANQDVVSMGTIAARDLMQSCRLANHGLAIGLLAVRQSALVARDGVKEHVLYALKDIASISEPLIEDRPMDQDIREVSRSLFKTGCDGDGL